MSKQSEREQFIAQLVRALPDAPVQQVQHTARCIMRAAASHGRLAVETCNGHPMQSMNPPPGCDMSAYNARVNKLQDRWDARIEREEKRLESLITRHATALGLSARFGGDPRGYTVKLHLPTGTYNTWGGKEEGYGVPQ